MYKFDKFKEQNLLRNQLIEQYKKKNMLNKQMLYRRINKQRESLKQFEKIMPDVKGDEEPTMKEEICLEEPTMKEEICLEESTMKETNKLLINLAICYQNNNLKKKKI